MPSHVLQRLVTTAGCALVTVGGLVLLRKVIGWLRSPTDALKFRLAVTWL